MDILPTITTGTTIMACVSFILFGCDVATESDAVDEPQVKSAAAEPLEESPPQQVLATVNDRAIDEAEVERRLQRLDEIYRHARRPFDDATRAEKREQVVERLIDRELLRDHLSHREIEIPEETVDEKLQRRIDNEFGSAAAFARYLQAEDIAADDFRRRVQEEIAISKLLVTEAEPIEIDESQLRDHYERIANRRPAGARIQTSSFHVQIPPASDEASREQIRDELDDAIRQVEDADELREMADRFSAPARIRFDELRWLERHHIPADTAQLLFSEDAPSQGLTPIIDTPRGFEVYWIHDRRDAGVRGFDEVEDLLRDRAHRSLLEKRRRELIQKLRDEADITINLPREPIRPTIADR